MKKHKYEEDRPEIDVECAIGILKGMPKDKKLSRHNDSGNFYNGEFSVNLVYLGRKPPIFGPRTYDIEIWAEKSHQNGVWLKKVRTSDLRVDRAFRNRRPELSYEDAAEEAKKIAGVDRK